MNRILLRGVVLLAEIFLLGAWEIGSVAGEQELFLSCQADNDLYQVLQRSGVSCRRVDSPNQAVQEATEGAAVMILADGYPQQQSAVDSTVFAAAAARKLRLYVEYPSMLAGVRSASRVTSSVGPTVRFWNARWCPRTCSAASCPRDASL